MIVPLRRSVKFCRSAVRTLSDVAEEKQSGTSWLPFASVALFGAAGYFYFTNKDLIQLPKLPSFESKPTFVPTPNEIPAAISTEIIKEAPDQVIESKQVPDQGIESEEEVREKIPPPEPVIDQKEPIPAEIVEDSPLVELFCEALGQKESSNPDSNVVDELVGKRVEVDVLGGKLLALAIKEAIDGQPNWEEFKARRKQALHDAMIIKTVFEKEQDIHKEKVDGLNKELTDSRTKMEDLEKIIEELREDVNSKIQKEVQKVEEKHGLLMRKMQDKLKLKAAEKELKERAQRINQTEKIRERVNSLALGLTYWMNQSEALTQTQRKVLETATMESSLNEELRKEGLTPMKLASLAVKDPFLQTMIRAIPEGPIPSKQQLVSDLEKLRTSLEPLALLPASGGGLISQLVATIGSQLKIRVRDLENGADDLSAKFDQIESSLAEGSIARAITQLTTVMEDSGGMHLAEDWIKEAKKHATLQHIRKMLLARGQELTMSISSL